MLTYAAKRLMLSVIVLWGAITFLFVLLQVMPGNIVDATIGSERVVDETTRRNIEAKYGLDKSPVEQYVRYIGRLSTGDFGSSQLTNESVGRIALDTAATSIRLSLLAVLFYNGVGIAAGVIAAARRYGLFDNMTAFLGVAMTAFPPFVSGIFMQWAFGVKPFQWGWPSWASLPVLWEPSKVHWVGPTIIPTLSSIKYLVLPLITLGFVNIGSTMRNARTLMLEVLRADYMRTARAKGLSQRRIIFRHGVRNAAIPLVTSMGADFPNTFGFAILTETVFNINGIGSRLAQAVFTQDSPVVLGLAAIIVFGIVIATLLVDLSYPLIDPRVKLSEVVE